MKKVLIICAAGMSSSLIAKKLSKHFESINIDIIVQASPISAATNQLIKNTYDLCIVSPQTESHFDKLEKLARKKNSLIIKMIAEDYRPVPEAIIKIADLIVKLLN